MLLPNTPVDAFPEFAPPRVEVQVPCLGLSATEVEELVTVPMEQAMAGIPGLDVMRSKSVTDLAQIDLRSTRAPICCGPASWSPNGSTVTPSLPKWASPPFMIQPLSSTSRAMKIGLSSDTVGHRHVDDGVLDHPREAAAGAGRGQHAIWGERLHMYQVQTDPAG